MMDVDLSIVKEERDDGGDDLEIKVEPSEDERKVSEYSLCEPCKGDGIVTRAEGKCRECVESMCTTCFRHHRKAKPCRYHTLVGDTTKQSASEQNETWRNCKYHTAEKIQFYCQRHESIGCNMCMILAHTECKTEMITVISTDYHESDSYKSLITKLSDLGEAFKECEQKIIDSKTDNERMHEQAVEEIKKFKRDIDNYLQVEEKCNYSELEKLRYSNSKELEGLERDRRAVVSKIERLTQKVDTKVYHGDALFINSVKCKNYIPGLEKALAKIKSGENVRKYRYVPNEALLKVIDKNSHLGHFEVLDRKSSSSGQPTEHEKQSAARKNARTSNHVQNNDSLKRGKKRKRNGNVLI